MMKAKMFSSKTAVCFLVVIIALYCYAMIIYPLFKGGWLQLHAVWFAWQTFNAGMIALVSALIGVLITIRLAKKQTEAQFVASRAFLPEALSEIAAYLDGCILVLVEAIQKLDTEAGNRQSLDTPNPTLNNEYRTNFSICIAHGPADLQAALSKISKQLQIRKARMGSLIEKEFQTNSIYYINKNQMMSELAEVCKLYALISSLFNYARFESESINEVLTKQNILNPVLKVRGDIADKLSSYLDERL